MVSISTKKTEAIQLHLRNDNCENFKVILSKNAEKCKILGIYLFFILVLLLVVWQGLFGLFLTWQYSPNELKRNTLRIEVEELRSRIGK